MDNKQARRLFRKVTAFQLKYTLGEKIGGGSFGTVFSATRDEDGLKVAVKLIQRREVVHWLEGDDGTKLIPLEIHFLSECQNIESVINMLDWYYSEHLGIYLIVMEFPEISMDLWDFLEMHGNFF